MATITPTLNYVKFIRGTPTAFQNLSNKNNDTLYFISETGSSIGSLYLGSKLIGSSSSLNQLTDILISSIGDNQILTYDADAGKWKNDSIFNIIGVMQGASNISNGASGLVPIPSVGDQNKFLRGDGTWSLVNVETNTFNTNVFDVSASKVVNLKDFDAALEGSILQKNSSGSISWVSPSSLYEELQQTVDNLQITVNSFQGGIRRTIKQTISDIDTTAVDADKYIYMVPNNSSEENNLYNEYMVIDNKVEKIGVNLSGQIVDYVSTSTFNSVISGLSNTYITKSAVGNLSSLILIGENTNLVEQVNDLTDRLTWYLITE